MEVVDMVVNMEVVAIVKVGKRKVDKGVVVKEM